MRFAVTVVTLSLALASSRAASADAHVPGFLPSTSGFRFANSWPSEPDYHLQFLGFDVPIGNAAQGLCGGMVFAVRDFFESGFHIPDNPTNPASGTPLFNYIFGRLIDSFQLPDGAARYYNLQSFWTSDGGRAQTIVNEWPLIKADLDGGTLSPLGLIRVHSDANPFRLGENHQVLAYGYEQYGTYVMLHIYDPNYASKDNQWLWFDSATGAAVTTSDNLPVYSLFRVVYVHKTPVPTGSRIWRNGFEGGDAAAWAITASAGIDTGRGFAASGANNGWVRNWTGWNGLSTTAPLLANSTCSVAAQLRTTAVVNGYFTVSDSTGLHEVHVTGFPDGAYHWVNFDFWSRDPAALLYVGLLGNGADAWIQFDEVGIACYAWD